MFFFDVSLLVVMLGAVVLGIVLTALRPGLFHRPDEADAEEKEQSYYIGGSSVTTEPRSRISLLGTTIVRVENGRIVEWSDYYDQNSSRRVNLAACFTDWIEY